MSAQIGYAERQESAAVVVSIAPLHSLVQGVMGDTGRAQLLLKGSASPHEFSLKASQLRILRKARVVFYGHHSLELFLPKILATLPSQVRQYPLLDSPRVVLLRQRRGGLWGKHEHSHSQLTAHHDAPWDTHFWLDPDNGAAMIAAIARQLSIAFPDNRARYWRNARVLDEKLRRLDQKLRHRLDGVGQRPFLVLHDALQYFERHYDLRGVGALKLHPEQALSARRLREIRAWLRNSDAVCVFQEAQFPGKLLHTVTAGTQARGATLDPLGSTLTPGGQLYFQLLENLARDLRQCLQQ